MAMLTIHHWPDLAKGLGEMRRVTRGPCLVMSFYASYVFYMVMHGMARRPQDHVPKFTYRSTKVERLIRFRDERLRNSYQRQLNEDPNLSYSKSTNSMFE